MSTLLNRVVAMRRVLPLLWASLLLIVSPPPAAHAGVAGPITVYPANSSLSIGSSLQCTAYVPISPNTVTWQVNGIVGGNATVGTVSATGNYQAPATVPTPNVVTISAQSTAYPSSIGSISLTLTRKVPSLWSVSPSQIAAGSYSVSFNGANFAPDSVATANGADVATTYISPTALVAKGSAVVGTIKFDVRQPGPGAVTTGSPVTVKVVATIVTVAVKPGSATVGLGTNQAFSATVTGSANTAVTWSVNGVTGGNSAAGTINSSGVYTAPASMPSPATVSIAAASVAAPSVTGQATVTLSPPPPPPVTVTVAPAVASVPMGGTAPFMATVANAANTAVTWSVNGTVGGTSSVGTITPAGVYTAPSSPPSSGGITIVATSVASPAKSGQAIVTLTAPPFPPVWLTGARFLEQSSFGPTPATLAQVQQLGIDAYLQQQFSLPETPILPTPNNSMGLLQSSMLYTYTSAPDQLRQRVAYSLSQILVTSANKLVYANESIPWLQLLSKHAFGNYRALLREMSLCPSMGKYLDLANSKKPGLAGGANENYARELMQLFTIGPWHLNQDGSYLIDPATQQGVPTYDQPTVAQVALALTGWTYATAPGATPNPGGNYEYFGAPMEPRPASHDVTAKSFLGASLPAGQSPDQDLDALLDTLFHHPNIAPFISTRLIRSLVTSNPSPAYITRVANVFDDNGAGVRGDLKAVVTAILTDAEARNDTPTTDGGRLKEPILQISELMRALGGGYTPGEQVTYVYDSLAQMPISPASVFSWFSPLYHVPGSFLFGPEFQIYTASEATLRGNFLYWILTNNARGDVLFDLTPFQPYGNDMPGLVEAVNQVLLFGRMDSTMKQVLINAAAPGYDAPTRITTVLYLTALSGQFAVQY